LLYESLVLTWQKAVDLSEYVTIWTITLSMTIIGFMEGTSLPSLPPSLPPFHTSSHFHLGAVLLYESLVLLPWQKAVDLREYFTI